MTNIVLFLLLKCEAPDFGPCGVFKAVFGGKNETQGRWGGLASPMRIRSSGPIPTLSKQEAPGLQYCPRPPLNVCGMLRPTHLEPVGKISLSLVFILINIKHDRIVLSGQLNMGRDRTKGKKKGTPTPLWEKISDPVINERWGWID